MGTLFVLTTAMRMISLSFDYGIVSANIPVLNVPLEDQSPQRLNFVPQKEVSENTTAVIIGANQDLYFGPVRAFSTDYANPRTKFIVKNRQGSAQIGELLQTVQKWHSDRKKNERIENDGIVILVPAASTPVSVITQAIAQLRSETLFSHVILANGMY